jgi:hypothetical protein
MIKNKSKAYGLYGGVTQQNHYVPPGAPGFVPQPSKPIMFTEEDRQLLQDVKEPAAYVNTNAPNILLRKTLDSQPGNVDTFMLTTSGQPEDVIIYTSNKDTVVLDDVAGSGLENTTDGPYDGGTF